MKKYRKWIVRGIVLAGLILFCCWQNSLLTVSRYSYHNDHITAELDGYTIVQISDLHNKLFGAGQKRLLNKIRECDPDLIVITGDLVDSNRTDINKALLFVRGATEIAPVYYVTGNHELLLESAEFVELMTGMQEVGVTLLDNDCEEILVGTDSFWLMGLADSSLQGNMLATLRETVQTDEAKTTVLLAHEPQFLERYGRQKIDLVLSGHAHGGQFRLPLVGGLIAPDQGFFPRYTAGAYRDGQTVMIVSRGLGNSIIPLRLFNYPDIVCVRFSAD